MPSAPVVERGYARPDLLAETDWLAENLNNPRVVIVDTRSPQLYEAGHIPGAVNLAAVGAIPRANGDMGEPADFEALAGALGVANDKTVVIYDAPSPAMGMLAWSILYFGHTDVKMLDGGFDKWSREGRPLSTEATLPAPAKFTARPVEDVYCSLDHARSSLGQPDTIFWDVRTDAEYEGSAPTGPNAPPRLGHIPNAFHLEWTELLDPTERTVKPAGELRALLSARGITPESEINCY
jgi:thiosulfate/3-mercaptopyruvate sulfurtransferase